jgi:molybdopterin/thiamine biosynthesis adenylyltransferase
LKNIELLCSYSNDCAQTFRPSFYRLSRPEDKARFESLLASDAVAFAHNDIYTHLKELIKCLHPSIKLTEEQYAQKINAHLKGQHLDEYGVWVYYPWNKKLVHILDEEEFIEVRTNRNRYKITREEQSILSKKTIGIIGLSVGQSIALTLAMERTCGTLRLADFDTAELSNLNRIRTGIHNLGLHKTIIAAREIAEIDPFLNVEIYSEGITASNIDLFFEGNGKLDLLVEVCDGLDIKIISRFKARSLGIPVVMDTNDRGMLDVERFDLDRNRPILHGLAGDLDPEKIKGLSNEDKIPYILKMVGADTLSTRMKASMMEVEQSINTWPQLASSVVLGGALTTDVCRRIFLNQFHSSGRYYIDLDELIKDEDSTTLLDEADSFGNYSFPVLDETLMEEVANQANIEVPANAVKPDDKIEALVEAGIWAPSGGNVQPWKFYYKNGRLFIFHDIKVSYSLLDFKNLGSYIATGASVENIRLQANAFGLAINVHYFPLGESSALVATIDFMANENGAEHKDLTMGIRRRLTNRNLGQRVDLPKPKIDLLQSCIPTTYGASVTFISDPEKMAQLGDILATIEMLRLIHPRGHYDTFRNELRWTEEENLKHRDGMDVATLGVSKAEVLALKVASDADAIGFIRSIKGGTALKKMANKAVAAASVLGIITMESKTPVDFLQAGQALERLWISANNEGISLQPISQYVFLAERACDTNDQVLGTYFKEEILQLKSKFEALLPELNGYPMFIFRLSIADEPLVKSLRKDLRDLFVNHHSKN